MSLAPALSKILINSVDYAEYVIGNLTVELPTIIEGIGGANFRLRNLNGECNAISPFHDVDIRIWREGDTETSVLTGKVMKKTAVGSKSNNEFYLDIEVEDLGYEAIVPPAFLTKGYSESTPKTIIQDALALTTSLSLDITDDASELDSTHDEPFEAWTPMQVIQKMCQISKAGTAIGANGYIDTSGKVHIFKRGKYTSAITPVILNYQYIQDVHPVRSKFTHYGTAEQMYPLSGDMCESLTPAEGVWTSGDSGTVWLDPEIKNIGDASIKKYLEYWYGMVYSKLTFTYNAGYEPDLTENFGLQNTVFQLRGEKVFDGTFKMFLEDDAGNKVVRNLPMTVERNDGTFEWSLVTAPIGLINSHEWQQWTGTTFNWAKIKKLHFWMLFSGAPVLSPEQKISSGTFWIDGFRMNIKRYRYTETATATYGTRTQKSSFGEETSDAECQKIAEAFINDAKTLDERIEQLTVEGNNGYKPAYKQPIILSNEGIDKTFRIVNITHEVENTKWKTILDLIL